MGGPHGAMPSPLPLPQASALWSGGKLRSQSAAVWPQFTLWAREGDVAMQQYLLHHWLHVGGPPPPHHHHHPCWNTMAAPDTAHSHTVLPHWKSHKTRVVQSSQAVHDIFWVFCFLTGCLTFAGFVPEDQMHFYLNLRLPEIFPLQANMIWQIELITVAH